MKATFLKIREFFIPISSINCINIYKVEDIKSVYEICYNNSIISESKENFGYDIEHFLEKITLQHNEIDDINNLNFIYVEQKNNTFDTLVNIDSIISMENSQQVLEIKTSNKTYQISNITVDYINQFNKLGVCGIPYEQQSETRTKYNRKVCDKSKEYFIKRNSGSNIRNDLSIYNNAFC